MNRPNQIQYETKDSSLQDLFTVWVTVSQ